jgi:hypothetical protein
VGSVFVGFEVSVRWEHYQVKVVFISHGLASFAPAEVNEFFGALASSLWDYNGRTILRIEVNITWGWFGSHFVGPAGCLFVISFDRSFRVND